METPVDEESFRHALEETEAYFDPSVFEWRIPNFLSELNGKVEVSSDLLLGSGPNPHKWMLKAGPISEDLKTLYATIVLVEMGENANQEVRKQGVPTRCVVKFIMTGGKELGRTLSEIIHFKPKRGMRMRFKIETGRNWHDTSYFPEGALCMKVRVLANYKRVHGPTRLNLEPIGFEPYQTVFKNPRHSNLTVLVGNTPFYCIREIVQHSCPAFTATYTDDIVLLPGIDPQVFLAMLEFIYYGGCHDHSVITANHSEAHYLAKRYKFVKFAKAIDELMLAKVQIGNSVSMILTAIQYQRRKLHYKLAAFIAFHMDAVKKTTSYRNLIQNPEDNKNVVAVLNSMEKDYKKKTEP